jgi:Flp pilus assembly pilin Flp
MIALLRDECGSTLTEYGVLMFSLAVASIAGLLLVSGTVNQILSNVLAGTTNIQLCPPGTAGCPGG